MTDLILEEQWMRWYPKKIFLKNKENNKKMLYYLDKLNKEDFHLELKDKKNSDLKIDLTKTEAYKIGFKKGFLKGQEENILLKNKLNSLFLNFENSFFIFESELYSRLLKIILKISSYVIGKKIDIDESILLKHIKKIIDKDGIFLKKPQIMIHSKNKKLIEKTFKDFLNTYQWKLVCDDSIDLNGCKVKAENSDIDTTVNARWQELCRFIDSEEY